MSSGTDDAFKARKKAHYVKTIEVGLLEGMKQAVGIKHDAGKPPITLIPRVALEQEAQAFAYGAAKYGKGNYQLGMKWSRMADAAMRHILAFMDGEDKDPETQLSHLAHARASLAMLIYNVENKVGEDDR